MSSNFDSYRDANNSNDDIAGEVEESKEDAETIKKCRELFTNIESGFSTFFKAILEKFGQQLSYVLKVSLECAICKELVIKAVNRQCTHLFCYHCITNWMKQSNNCPICRDDVYLGVKTPLIDRVMQLLVDLSLTDEEKMERINITQQRSTPSLCADDEILIVLDSNKRILKKFSKEDLVIIGRSMCINQARHFLLEIIGSEEFQKQRKHSKEEDETYLRNLFETFESDIMNCKSILVSFPDSLKRRFVVEY